MADKRELVIIGGGFTGLACAYYAAQKGFHIHLHEASERFGGLIGSRYLAEGLVETAANGLLNSGRVEALFADLGLKLCPTLRRSRRRYIFRGRPRRWPFSASASLRLAWGAMKFVFRRSSLQPLPGESVADWTLRHFGAEVLRYGVAPALGGIYAGDVRTLSASLILESLFSPRFPRLAPRDARGTVGAERGLQALVEAWVARLLKMGVNLHLNSRFALAGPAAVPHVVCVRADQVEGVLSSAAPKFPNLQMLPLVSVTAFFEPSSSDLEGFGCLFPEEEGFSALGALFNAHIFPNRANGLRSETWIFGGARDRQVADLSEDEILSRLARDRRRLTGRSQDPIRAVLTRWPRALPHYTVEWERTLKAMRLPQNIHLCGNYLGGIGLSKILDRAHYLIETLSQHEDKR